MSSARMPTSSSRRRRQPAELIERFLLGRESFGEAEIVSRLRSGAAERSQHFDKGPILISLPYRS
jgi:hypothetical protein